MLQLPQECLRRIRHLVEEKLEMIDLLVATIGDTRQIEGHTGYRLVQTTQIDHLNWWKAIHIIVFSIQEMAADALLLD